MVDKGPVRASDTVGAGRFRKHAVATICYSSFAASTAQCAEPSQSEAYWTVAEYVATRGLAIGLKSIADELCTLHSLSQM